MTAPFTPDAAGIERALAALGPTREGVAATLLALGCTGTPESDDRCPVAVYLRTACGLTPSKYGRDVSVAGDVMLWGTGIRVELPDPVLRFAAAFDDGMYRELVA